MGAIADKLKEDKIQWVNSTCGVNVQYSVQSEVYSTTVIHQRQLTDRFLAQATFPSHATY